MGIFADKFRRKLGLKTEKEVLDQKISHYGKGKIDAINHSIAIRNQLISSVNERIRQLEKIINDNQKFIDLCEFIKNKAIEQIKKRDSSIQDEKKKKKGRLIIKSNYKVMNDYLSSLISKGLSSEFILNYNEQLSNILKKNWMLYADNVIVNKGNFNNEECYDLYASYAKILDLMNNGFLKNEKNIPIKFNEKGIDLILKVYEYCNSINNFLALYLQNLKIKLNNLNSDFQSEEYILKQIDEIKQILRSSEEYTRAKASHDYLEQITRK